MTVTYLGNSQWMGLSTDTKPTGIATGSSFRETDINVIKFYDGTFWRIARFGQPSAKKIGWWSGLANNAHGEGLLSSSPGSTTVASVTDTTGRGIQFSTTSVAGTYTGTRGATQFTSRQYNPVFRIRFRLDQDNTGNTMRFFTGWATSSGTFPNNDDPLSGLNGIGILVNSTDTTWKIGHNDAGGAGLAAQTNITGSPALDTNIHIVEITADDAGARFLVSWDGGANQVINSDIPSSIGILNAHASMYNATATNISWDLFWAEVESDK